MILDRTLGSRSSITEHRGTDRLRDAQAALDSAVRAAYGMKAAEHTLAFLLRLNLELAEKEAKGEPITRPGLPNFHPKPAQPVTDDCVRPLAEGSDGPVAD